MSPHPSDSQILDGYRLIRFLGRGGFGEVWLCRSDAMGDYRALKWIPATHADRLEKEYESLLHFRNAAARLRSPHLVPIEHVDATWRRDSAASTPLKTPRAGSFWNPLRRFQHGRSGFSKTSPPWLLCARDWSNPPRARCARSAASPGMSTMKSTEL